MDYIPNVFEKYLENSFPEVRQIPLPRWFVAYYRNGSGNFIHASWYLSKEIGTIPEGNIKKYGTVTVKAPARKLLDVVIALDSHSEGHCNAAAYCFHCRNAHQVRSRQCPRFHLEQDILQLANSQFISLGSARRWYWCDILCFIGRSLFS
ncbi:hypothetical protein E2C01_068320 [Portunus trituberculatus]|uniref:Uncharacterized protein n=1 Tax=Portunus trituberculatus TaxID=210409 RepID=A0A5B7HW64_PORTR|nr:hypothetical protein [Portunus trituberculatus]